MKKTICILLLSFAFAGFTGCYTEVEATGLQDTKSMFVEAERTINWTVVYDKETKVMYAVARGVFTPLIDESGNPKIWDGN